MRCAAVVGARIVFALLSAGMGLGCARPSAEPTPAPTSSPRMLLDRAIDWAGGADALSRARALVWEGDATVTAGGRVVHITGQWAVQPPDTAIVATYDVMRGPGTTRALVLAAPRGWVWSNTRFDPMPALMLANERDEFYLYHCMRLVTLRDADVTLRGISADERGLRGIRAEHAGRPTVDLFFDGQGRLAHVRTTVRSAGDTGSVTQDLWLTGTIEASGIRWPREIRIAQNGAEYFALELKTLRVQPRIDDARFSGPR